MSEAMNEELKSQCVVIRYTNWRGETGDRLVRPLYGYLAFKATRHHPESQWVFDAHDVKKDAYRTFALKDVHSWRPATAEELEGVKVA